MGTFLTKNFNLEEFLIHQVEKPSPDVLENLRHVAIVLQRYRDTIFGSKPIKITSGWRSEKYNREVVHGASKSYHIQGLAVDFKVMGMSKQAIYNLMDEYHFGGVEYYLNPSNNACHIDLRGKNVRFDSNNKILKCNYNIDKHNYIFHHKGAN